MDEELNDLKEFLQMLDFERVSKKEIRIVENYFVLEDLPAAIQVHLDKYFKYLDSIQ